MIATVFGTRPEIIKMSLLIPLLDKHFDHSCIYTSQHYSANMSQIFFDEFGIRPPDHDLGINSSDPEILKKKIKSKLFELKPDQVLVYGDTNTTLAGALAGKELGLPVIHVEAGGRSFDLRMPEERNRRETDHLGSMLFTQSAFTKDLLAREKITRRVYVTGLTSVDVALKFRKRAEESRILETLRLSPGSYSLLTSHRHENIDDKETLSRLLFAFAQIQSEIIWPVHPHAEKNIAEWGLKVPENVRAIEPQGNMDFLKLLMNAKMLLTDSGGAVQEAVTLKVPCIMIRDSTEMQETLINGNCVLSGTNPLLISYFAKMVEETSFGDSMRKAKNPYGDGRASEKVASILKEELPGAR